jgi:tRNA A-37 threonylcarbamoyl transferase component Bud32
MTRTCLKKTLRTSKRELKIRTDKCVAVFEKSFLGNCDGRDLIDHIDQLMEKGQIFKDGNTCYVSRLRFNGSDIVIKRYNHKGLIYSLRHTIKKSRGRRSWLNAHRLGILRIPTAGPVGFIEQMNGPIVWKSYFVTRYLEGQKLHDFLRDSNVTKQQRTKVIDQCRELLGKLDENLITHGDLKHTNILIGDDGPMLLDLDGMKAHKFKWFHKIRHAKDLSRIGVL